MVAVRCLGVPGILFSFHHYLRCLAASPLTPLSMSLYTVSCCLRPARSREAGQGVESGRARVGHWAWARSEARWG